MEQDDKNDLANALRDAVPLFWQAGMAGKKPVEEYGIIITEEAREKIIAALTE